MQNPSGGKCAEEWLRIDFEAPGAYFNRNNREQDMSKKSPTAET
jgi:hypothetical protein